MVFRCFSNEESDVTVNTGEDAMTANAAGRYATALFELAKTSDAVSAIEADMSAFSAMLSESSELVEALASPLFPAEEKNGVLGALSDKAGFQDMTTNAFGVAVANGRAGDLGEMAAAFLAMAAADRGVVTAEVQTAAELTKKQTEALAASLKGAFGRDIEVRTEVRPELLGGLIVKVGSRMFDSSLRTKLDGMKNAMKEA